MSFDFLEAVDFLTDFSSGGNSSDGSDNSKKCPEPIDRQAFYLFMLVPAVLCTTILMFTKMRKNLKQDCLGGRPGLVFPQHMMSRKNRISFAAAFGAVANVCIEVIYNGQYAFYYTGPLYLKVFVALASMLIYGLDYYPLFASLAVNNIPGYIIGTLYAWTLAIVVFYRSFKCDTLTPLTVGLLIARGLPLFVCHIYLCFSIPARLIRCIRDRNKDMRENLDDLVLNSYAGIHVKKILRRPLPPPPDPTTKREKVKSIVTSLLTRLVYSRVDNFRYSGRVLCIITVSFMLVYQSTVELLIFVIPYIKIFEISLNDEMDSIGWHAQPGEPSSTADTRDFVSFLMESLLALKASLLTSISLAFALNILILLHSMTTYRRNLLALYKGNSGDLIPKTEKSNPSLLIGCMQYAGFQVAYIGWGFYIQLFILFLICLFLAAFIILIKSKVLDQWILDKIMAVWPVMLTTLVIKILQLVLAKFVFLEKRGAILSITNRRLFFIVVYFMFFYNIFLGLFSCLLRIFKAIGTGVLYLPRLDHSTLARQFEWFDPGFNAYCGFMHVESVHTHPVAITFVRMLQAEAFGKYGKSSSDKMYKYIDLKDVQIESKVSQENKAKRRHRLVIFKWKLIYTLLRNPELILIRKGEILRQLELLKLDTLAEEAAVEMREEKC